MVLLVEFIRLRGYFHFCADTCAYERDGVVSFGDVWPGLYRISLNSQAYAVRDVKQNGQSLLNLVIVNVRRSGEVTVVVAGLIRSGKK